MPRCWSPILRWTTKNKARHLPGFVDFADCQRLIIRYLKPFRPTNFIRHHHHSVSRSGDEVIWWTVKSAPLNSSSASSRMPTVFLSRP